MLLSEKTQIRLLIFISCLLENTAQLLRQKPAVHQLHLPALVGPNGEWCTETLRPVFVDRGTVTGAVVQGQVRHLDAISVVQQVKFRNSSDPALDNMLNMRRRCCGDGAAQGHAAMHCPQEAVV